MTWPPVFDGIGALFVRADNDPDVQAARIPGLTWAAIKVNGADASPQSERGPWSTRMAARGVTVGSWIYCYTPDMVDYGAAGAFRIYDVEAEFKTDEGAPADWPAKLVATHNRTYPGCPAAVTSYGAIPGYGNQPSSINFQPFAEAGWPVFAQLYDAFDPVTHPEMQDCQDTYLIGAATKFPGPYPNEGLHQLVRSLTLAPTMAVYRPEGLDG